jgi:hypothetical protein
VKGLGLALAALVWIGCWLLVPASWWLNTQILDEQAFADTMTQVLEIEEVDQEITDRATAEVLDNARTFVDRTVPFLAPQADLLLDRAEPAVSGVVTAAVNSQPGEKAMLVVARQVHNAFVAWLDEDTLGQPGLQADLGQGSATFDLDEMLAGEQVSLGPIEIPLDALDLPGIGVPVPLPPDWLRVPVNLVRSAFVPGVIGIALSATALFLLDRPRLRALAVASLLTALTCAVAILVINTSWTVSGADSADWTITRAIAELLVRPWITAYTWVIVGMAALAAGAFLWDRHRLAAARSRT